MSDELDQRCVSLNAELEFLFAQAVWDRARIAGARRKLDAAQRQQAALIRSRMRELAYGNAHLQANHRCATADQRG